MLTLDQVCGLIISEYYKQQQSPIQNVMNKRKMPCTRCGVHVSPTWRPGPCGTSSLCNRCGLLYMVRNQRPRMVDLVLSNTEAVWMERDANTLHWSISIRADTKDSRIRAWMDHEEERSQFVQSKKRKFVEM